jgi:hypothetical protein
MLQRPLDRPVYFILPADIRFQPQGFPAKGLQVLRNPGRFIRENIQQGNGRAFPNHLEGRCFPDSPGPSSNQGHPIL